MPKLIIFDLGGVITSGEVEQIDRQVAAYLGVESSTLRAATARYKRAVTTGAIGLKELYSAAISELHLPASPAAAVACHLEVYRGILGDLDRETLGLVANLRRKYHVVALANAEREVIPVGRELGLYDPFEAAYISCEMGMQKPDADIYRAVLADYGCKPGDAVFIDDKLENVQGAERLGIHAIHYRPPARLADELTALGVEL
ncbi:MAG: HAD family phosphatase [Candidatus Aenigmarchaeota archaeon]|nr:HAD family phosphatase [Candidatus Aenigmarchaeota archaeon]